MSDLAIGIDLGTTNSCAAVYHNGTLTIIPNDEGSRTTVSCVAFTDTERLIGDAAKSLVVSNPENTIFDSKRMIGRRFDDPKIQQDMKTWQFQVVDEDGMPKIRTEVKGKTKTFTPEEISGMVLAKMKEIAESHLREKVTDAVISVPACFNDSQRQATLAAGRIAGLNVIRIINEPTAAALAYKVDKNLQGIKTVLVFDLGGGTLDVSIIKIGDNLLFDVKSTAGDSHLGGEDFDNVLVAHFVEEFKTKHQRDLRTCPKAVRKLRIACESAKRTLSGIYKARIDLSCLFEGIDFHSKLTRAQFEGMCMDLFLSTLEPVKRALSDANMDKGSIDEVVLVGGSTKIPKIRKLLKIFFDGKEPSMPVNRDEAVAYGAALLAVEKIKKLKLVSILDVTPLTLGINTKGGVMLPIIKRNSLLPCQATQIYFTVVDNRSNINSEIEVYQGEQAMVKDNHLVGRFRIGVTPHQALPEGMLQFTLSFFLDMDGILNVVSDSDHIRGVTVFAHKIGLSSDEVDRLASEARRFEREEKAQREDRNVARTELESFVNSVKLSVEHSPVDSLSATDRKFVISLCESFKAWMKFNALAKTEEIRGKITEARIRLTEFMTVDKAMDLRPDLLPDGDLIIDLEAE